VKANVEAFRVHGSNSDVFILERSPFTDPLFVEILHDDGLMDDYEYEQYYEWWNLWNKVMPYEPDHFVYLRPDMETCMDRLRKRNRDGEQGVSVEYQQKLMDLHDAKFVENVHLVDSHGKMRSVPCVILNTNDDFVNDVAVRERLTLFFEKLIRGRGA
jgi:deoxyadenosine/deoxycytidine kinase